MPEFIHDDQSIFYELVTPSMFKLRTPILMLHGNGESMHIFKPLISKLLHTRSFVLMDSRLHGKSYPLEGASTKLSYEAIASDALALMERLDISEFDAVGYSDGGIAAIIMAIRSVKVRRIMTIGANASPSGLTLKAKHEIAAAYEKALKENDHHTAELMRLMLDEPHISDAQLASISCKATIIIGSRDAYISRKHSEHIADMIPHASHICIDGAGHEIPHTHIDDLAALIQKAL